MSTSPATSLELHEPGDPGYASACTLFNSMIDRRPRYVAACSSPDDVVRALALAREHGLPVSVRAGGHSVAGHSLVDDGLVLDVRGMDDVSVNPNTRVARIGGGATWAHVDRATQAHGLATTGGRVSTTGVVGLTTGGGSGWIERRYGLACDNLLAVELVTADGRFVRASAREHPELLWAMRGGGGNFGVVTAIELRLHPVGPEVVGGLVLHPAERAREVMTLWRDVMSDAPEELGLAFAWITAPDEEGIPPELVGRPAVIIAGMYAGPVDEAERVLAPIREFGPPAADFFETTTYADFQCSLDDPPGYRNYWTEEHADELSDELIDAIVEHCAGMPLGPAQLFMLRWDGAIARAGADTSPLGGREAWIVHPLLLWEDAADDERNMAYGRSFRELLAPFATGVTYPNFLGDEGASRVRVAFGASAERLARVKAAWDPDNVFNRNQNVRPAA